MSGRVARLVSVKGISVRIIYESMAEANTDLEKKDHLCDFYRVEAISLDHKPLFIGFLMERGGNTYQISNGHGFINAPTALPCYIEQDAALEAMIAHAQETIRRMAILMGCQD